LPRPKKQNLFLFKDFSHDNAGNTAKSAFLPLKISFGGEGLSFGIALFFLEIRFISAGMAMLTTVSATP